MSRFSLSSNPSETMRAIADKVRALRKKQHLNQQELAERSGVSFGSIKRFETSGQISFESLLKIANVLNRLDDFDPVFEMKDDLSRVAELFSPKIRS